MNKPLARLFRGTSELHGPPCRRRQLQHFKAPPASLQGACCITSRACRMDNFRLSSQKHYTTAFQPRAPSPPPRAQITRLHERFNPKNLFSILKTAPCWKLSLLQHSSDPSQASEAVGVSRFLISTCKNIQIHHRHRHSHKPDHTHTSCAHRPLTKNGCWRSVCP